MATENYAPSSSAARHAAIEAGPSRALANDCWQGSRSPSGEGL